MTSVNTGIATPVDFGAALPGGYTRNNLVMPITATNARKGASDFLAITRADAGITGSAFITEIFRRAFLRFDATPIVSSFYTEVMDLWCDITSILPDQRFKTMKSFERYCWVMFERILNTNLHFEATPEILRHV